jgi:hypothetical protein
MRFSRATVITTGAVATLAVMGAAPAMAATAGIAKSATVFGQVQGSGKHAAPDTSMADLYGMNGTGSWGAPWQAQPQPFIGVLDGSVVNAVPWQICGSTVMAGVGGAVPLNSPNTVLGGCNNANTTLIN